MPPCCPPKSQPPGNRHNTGIEMLAHGVRFSAALNTEVLREATTPATWTLPSIPFSPAFLSPSPEPPLLSDHYAYRRSPSPESSHIKAGSRGALASPVLARLLPAAAPMPPPPPICCCCCCWWPSIRGGGEAPIAAGAAPMPPPARCAAPTTPCQNMWIVGEYVWTVQRCNAAARSLCSTNHALP